MNEHIHPLFENIMINSFPSGKIVFCDVATCFNPATANWRGAHQTEGTNTCDDHAKTEETRYTLDGRYDDEQSLYDEPEQAGKQLGQL